MGANLAVDNGLLNIQLITIALIVPTRLRITIACLWVGIAPKRAGNSGAVFVNTIDEFSSDALKLGLLKRHAHHRIGLGTDAINSASHFHIPRLNINQPLHRRNLIGSCGKVLIGI